MRLDDRKLSLFLLSLAIGLMLFMVLRKPCVQEYLISISRYALQESPTAVGGIRGYTTDLRKVWKEAFDDDDQTTTAEDIHESE